MNNSVSQELNIFREKLEKIELDVQAGKRTWKKG